jgi:sulfur carrier protein ThiS
MHISLVILPGNGRNTVEVTRGSTLQELLESRGLTDRQVIVNGSTVERSAWSTFTFSGEGRVEVVCTTASKGN